jgi:hypothetical protein
MSKSMAVAPDTARRSTLIIASEDGGARIPGWLIDNSGRQSPDVVVAKNAACSQSHFGSGVTRDDSGETHSAKTNARSLKPAASVIVLPPRPRSTTTFEVLQEWEGTVLERTDSLLRVRLIDKSSENDGHIREQSAEIPLAEIDEDDLAMVEPGAVFYWSIGYRIESGTRRRESALQFRRVPHLLDRDLKSAEDVAKDRIRRFGW